MLQHSFALQCSRSRRNLTVLALLSHASSTFGIVNGPAKHRMCIELQRGGPLSAIGTEEHCWRPYNQVSPP